MANKRSLIIFCLLCVVFILTTILTKYHHKLNFDLPNYEQETEQAQKEWQEVEAKFEEGKRLLQNPATVQKALSLFQNLEKQIGENSHLIKFRLQAQLAAGQAEEATQDLNKLITIYDGDPDFYRLHTLASIRTNNIKAADSSLKILYRFNEKDPYNYLLTAFLLASNKQKTEAQKYYSAAKQAYGQNFQQLVSTPLLKALNDQLFVAKALAQ